MPDGTIAAFDTTLPSNAFNVETKGLTCPDGNNVRKLRTPRGTTVAFSEYACAVEGSQPQDFVSMFSYALTGAHSSIIVPSSRSL